MDPNRGVPLQPHPSLKSLSLQLALPIRRYKKVYGFFWESLNLLPSSLYSEGIHFLFRGHPLFIQINRICDILITQSNCLFFTVEGAQDEEHVDGELLWYLEILSQMLQCDGSEVVQYKEMLKEIIRLSIHLKNKKAYSRAGKVRCTFAFNIN